MPPRIPASRPREPVVANAGLARARTNKANSANVRDFISAKSWESERVGQKTNRLVCWARFTVITTGSYLTAHAQYEIRARFRWCYDNANHMVCIL